MTFEDMTGLYVLISRVETFLSQMRTHLNDYISGLQDPASCHHHLGPLEKPLLLERKSFHYEAIHCMMLDFARLMLCETDHRTT